MSAPPAPSPSGRDGQEPPAHSSVIVWFMNPVITRGDIHALCHELARQLQDVASGSVVCDLTAVTKPDTVLIEALARLQLTAMRLGHHIRLRNASTGVRDLLALTGLADILPLYCGL